MKPVNLLPWRQSRQRYRLRLMCLVTAAIVLIGAMSGFALGLCWRVQTSTLESILGSEREENRALARRETQLQQHRQKQEQQQNVSKRRQATLAWQKRLADLASALPEQAWLTALSWQNNTLTLSGSLNRFSALQALDKAMQQVDGFQPATAGKMTRDKEGRWLFNYQMTRSVSDAAP